VCVCLVSCAPSDAQATGRRAAGGAAGYGFNNIHHCDDNLSRVESISTRVRCYLKLKLRMLMFCEANVS